MLRVLDIFSGIGAYALGVERAGMKVVAFCESEEFPRKILRKHWPDVPIYEDVRTLTADTLRRDGIAVDVIVGGWPCQDISVAGSRVGLDGERSGLWSEIARLAGEIRPQFLILENSSNLLNSSPDGEPPGRDFGRVLGDLAALGYDAEWHCLPAAAFDAPHIRDRLWIVAAANASSDGLREQSGRIGGKIGAGAPPANDGSPQPVANTARVRRKDGGDASANRTRRAATAGASKRGALVSDNRSGDAALANANGAGPHAGSQSGIHRGEASSGAWNEQPERCSADDVADPYGFPSIGASIARRERHTWEPEPNVGRVAARSASGVDRIRALGNCNPPIIPETIARAVIAAHANGLKPADGTQLHDGVKHDG